MDVGAALVERARAIGAASIAVVGTSKNAGKTVVVSALCAALERSGARYAVCSIGRDGEAFDAIESTPKPRLFLRPGAMLATAAPLVPRSPALEIVALTSERGALGPIVLGRVRAPGYFELAGPPQASAMQRIARELAARGSDFVVIDGAVDRIAVLRDGGDAIVVAVGAAGAPTLAHAVDDAAALVARLRLPHVDATRPFVPVTGALTASAAAAFVRAGERRQIVVRDPVQIAFGGRAFLTLATKLALRCERPLRPIACTVAPIGPERSFEPRAFLHAVAAQTQLPAFDVYAGASAA